MSLSRADDLAFDTAAVAGATAACEQKRSERVGELSKHETERTLATWRRRSSSPPCGRRSAATAARSRACGPTTSRRSPIAAAVERAGVDAAEIEDVYLGCANQAGEDNRNVARMAALLAGLPESVAGVTVNRLCASGLSAVVGACHAIAAGDGDLFVAGGVESMSRAPLVTAKPDAAFPRGDRTMYDTTLGWRFPNPRSRRCSRSSRWARRARTSPSAGASRARTRTRSRCVAAALGGGKAAGRFADELVPVGERRARRAPAAGHDAPRSSRPEARVPRRTARSRPATRAGSTTAPRRS